ncbi:MAG: RNA recognition motif domain-containing protein [Pseudobacter sp.]|uniref:RNA recognition motif domain-containing protein n=1 Tax=Pseudobacter sp. TaxID=2045420 RepID=UPI003F80C7E5
MLVEINNLNSRTTTAHLMQLFFPFGKLESVRIVREEQSGRSSCFGIVSLSYRAGMMAITELHNRLFMGHYLEVYETDLMA